MSLFGLFSKRKTDRNTFSTSGATIQRPTVKALGTSQSLDRAYAVDGTVYCVANHGSDFVIGYYELNEDKTACKVFCESDRREIGKVESDSPSNMAFAVTLNRLYLWDRQREMGRRYNLPSPISDEVGRAYSSFIEDVKTHQTIAEIEGSIIEAAAAFICLTYEVTTDTKYGQFFSIDSW